MAFSWDSNKGEKNLRDRGFVFAFAVLVFEEPTLEKEDHRRDYDERRMVAIGVVADFHLAVVYTDRETARGEGIRRIISARRSNRRERQAYRRRIQC